MKKISTNLITKAVQNLVVDSNIVLNGDIKDCLKTSMEMEKSPVGSDILNKLIENAEIAKERNLAICQDTGMVVVFVEIGQNVQIVDGNITDAINEGIRRGYKEGYLRNSIVDDPIFRKNTGDNTPGVIHYDIISGDNLKISTMPKGFGSENMSRLKMLKPSDGVEGIKNFVVETVDIAGPNPCPPIIVGVGIGGSFEKAAILSKKALLRPLNERNSNDYLDSLEKEILKKINNLGIGPSGLGGIITALGVNIEIYPTHIAGLPIAVNISCHATRHAEIIL